MNMHLKDVDASFRYSSEKRYKHPTDLGDNCRLHYPSHPSSAVFEDAHIGLIGFLLFSPILSIYLILKIFTLKTKINTCILSQPVKTAKDGVKITLNFQSLIWS